MDLSRSNGLSSSLLKLLFGGIAGIAYFQTHPDEACSCVASIVGITFEGFSGMADFQRCLSQGLLGYLCPGDLSAVRSVDFDSAQQLLFERYSYYSMLLSVPQDCESLADLQAIDAKHHGVWQEVRAIFSFYPTSLTHLPPGTYSVASFMRACAGKEAPLRRQVIFEIAALAEKDHGNVSFKSCKFEEALASYTKALVLLGLTAKKDDTTSKGLILPTDPKISNSPQRSLELSMALLSNRSLCFLKLGRTLDAIADAEKAVERMQFDAGRPVNLSAYTKATHRLASALVRAGRFKESLLHLDAIDKVNGSRTATIELRGVIKSLRQQLGHMSFTFDDGYPPHSNVVEYCRHSIQYIQYFGDIWG